MEKSKGIVKILNWKLEYFMVFVVGKEYREKMKGIIIGGRPLFKKREEQEVGKDE